MERSDDYSGSTDGELLRRVRAGDKRGFDALVRKYQHRILHVINQYVSNPAAAQDVAQEAFIRAYRGLGSFRGESGFYTWLYRIAVNTAKNHLVSEARKNPHGMLDVEDAETIYGESDLKDYGTPERVLLSEELRKQVLRAIDALPEELKESIVLREIEGMSYEEIAVVMECPVGTVRSRISRAREAIDRRLRVLL